MTVRLTSPVPVSCFIIAKNEADRIGPVIESVVGWVDEVVVIDSGSTDGTIDIARGLGARVVHNDWPGYGPQKRFGEDQCRNDWVLNLDADEVPTDELCREMIALFDHGRPPAPFYRFRIKLVYPGDTRPRLWADYHNYIRLYDRRAGRFSDSPVHDTVQTSGGRTVQLRGVAYHFSYRSFSYLVEKLNSYGDLQAKTIRKQAPTLLALRLPFEFPVAFTKYYLLRRHFTGGRKGFTFAMINAFFRFLRVVKLLEAAGSPPRSPTNSSDSPAS
ncbi:glycosyltransferase involved in cell wall biosynthesis [Tepidamorphus gemmatus]|uniref:Glycosyltransferase involved in cell wall biosynthesis n=1 Tax=Tepidamorphus gemmatus TaxID=747076 RepID=A0A4R3MIU9_9HYPH|nr:glycosyltransferase family 2 protein [Tepidamorphus gemmatus]TCT12432.1 glycosyltransferase involved in cell wall biosynthesis [Tepidamorphus gemmatus]